MAATATTSTAGRVPQTPSRAGGIVAMSVELAGLAGSEELVGSEELEEPAE